MRSLGRRFGWLWASYAVSTFGTRLAFDALPLIAVLVLHAGPAQVSALAAAGVAVGAVVAVPLGPWVEFRRKWPVMVATDLVRCAVLATVPVAYLLGTLTFVHLLVVAVVVGAADIGFGAASGAFLKTLVPREEDLLVANGRFESTAWTATLLGPPIGGAAMSVFGPVVTVLADAVSYLVSAVGLTAVGPGERHPEPAPRSVDLLGGWRHILADPVLCPLFANTILVNGLILATAPLLAVLMLGPLGFAPWQYGLAFAAPCVGGLVGAWSAPRLVGRFGHDAVLRTAGTLRACWSVGLAFVGSGVGGLALVIAVQFGLVTCMGVFVPVFATLRLERTPSDRVVRTLTAWSVTGKAVIAALTALWGVLAQVTSPRAAVAAAGVLLLATPLLLPGRISPAGPRPR